MLRPSELATIHRHTLLVVSWVALCAACGTSPPGGTAGAADAAADATAPLPDAAPSPDAPHDASTGADAAPALDGATGDAAPYDILNQPPGDVSFFYPHGLVSTPLPNAGAGGPTAHLMPNSDAVIATLLGETAAGGLGVQPSSSSGGFLTGTFASPGSDDGGQVPLYFGRKSDVVYRPIDVKACGPLFEPLAQRTGGLITNLAFHAPAGALFSGQGGGDDNSLAIWDESDEGISGGKVLGFYTCCGGATSLPACPGVGADGVAHAGTEADPCTFKAGGAAYCSFADPVAGSGFGGGSAIDGSNGTGPYSAWIRNLELLYGHVQHASNWNTNCEATAGGGEPRIVFPATLEPGNGGALPCANPMALAPPNGALYFLDYTSAQLDCMNPQKAACNGADGKPVTKLDALHWVFIEQLARFGGYQSDTGGPPSTPGNLAFYHVESSESYAYYGAHGFPSALTGTCPDCYGTFQTFFNQHCDGAVGDANSWCYVNKRTPPSSAFAWETRMFYGLPFTLEGPTCSAALAASGQCGVGKHLHIADPCVAVAMAGLPQAMGSGRTWAACP